MGSGRRKGTGFVWCHNHWLNIRSFSFLCHSRQRGAREGLLGSLRWLCDTGCSVEDSRRIPSYYSLLVLEY